MDGVDNMEYYEVINNFEIAYNLPTRPEERPYSSNYIFDENESVSWNRQEVIRRNEKIKEAMKQLQESRYQAIKDAEEDIVKYLCESYKTVSENKVRKTFQHIYSNYYTSYFDYDIERVIETCEDILEIMMGED